MSRLILIRARLAVGVAVSLAAGLLAGCGFISGTVGAGADIKVTENFGATSLGSDRYAQTPSGTQLQLLSRAFHVQRAPHGGAITAINGVASTTHTRWTLYVNGIEAAKRAAETAVHKGDQVWWDLHTSTGTDTVPAVVGSYPEPFSTGTGGQQFPTVLTCGSGLTQACSTVAKSLTKANVKVADQALGTGSGSDSLAVLVGTFAQLRGVIAAELLQAGPSQSGVFARFVGSSGQALELDNSSGDVAGTLYGSAGLIAATEQPGLNEPVWLVTGTDIAGVRAAAADLTPAKLRNHFAVAISGGKVIPLPLDPNR